MPRRHGFGGRRGFAMLTSTQVREPNSEAKAGWARYRNTTVVYWIAATEEFRRVFQYVQLEEAKHLSLTLTQVPLIYHDLLPLPFGMPVRALSNRVLLLLSSSSKPRFFISSGAMRLLKTQRRSYWVHTYELRLGYWKAYWSMRHLRYSLAISLHCSSFVPLSLRKHCK